jgi:hypothetical protein
MAMTLSQYDKLIERLATARLSSAVRPGATIKHGDGFECMTHTRVDGSQMFYGYDRNANVLSNELFVYMGTREIYICTMDIERAFELLDVISEL